MHNSTAAAYKLPPVPDADALDAWRQKARKRKAPTLDLGAHGGLPGLGEFKILEVDGAHHLEWRMAGGPPKCFAFDLLGRDPSLSAERLEVGWLVANLWHVQGRRVRDAIPGPNEAMRESARFFDAEERWRHWAQVPVGHMLF
jgi:hypothetical protein